MNIENDENLNFQPPTPYGNIKKKLHFLAQKFQDFELP